MPRRIRQLFIAMLLIVICVLPLALVSGVPRTDRSYVAEQAIMPAVHSHDGVAEVRHVRSFQYRSDGGFSERYRDLTIDLRQVRRVWFGLSPFAEWRGPAHAFLSFEFADSQFLSISVEARKEAGEEYSPWRGMLRRYELMYVIADERDIVGVRSVVQGDPVYLYPGRATPAQASELLAALLRRAEGLRRNPEYYHTLANNCATNLAAAVNAVTADRVPWDRALVLPGFSDTFAYDQGLLDIPAPPDEVRERYRVDQRAREAYNHPDFSHAIRRSHSP